MIDIKSESLFPFRDIPAWCEEHLGNRIHISTAHRWRLRGSRGVKLETILAGGTRYTSEEAMTRFFSESTAAADGSTIVRVPDSIANADIESARQFLVSEGV